VSASNWSLSFGKFLKLRPVVDQARERQAQLDLLRQQRETASAGLTAGLQPPSTPPPTDLQALIQQAVQQALAAQQPSSTGQAPATGTTPAATPPTSPADWCPLHQVAMEQRRNAKGTWYSHWVVSEQRYCKGKASRHRRRWAAHCSQSPCTHRALSRGCGACNRGGEESEEKETTMTYSGLAPVPGPPPP